MVISEISDSKKEKMADAGDGPPNKRQKIQSPALTPNGSESGLYDHKLMILHFPSSFRGLFICYSCRSCNLWVCFDFLTLAESASFSFVSLILAFFDDITFKSQTFVYDSTYGDRLTCLLCSWLLFWSYMMQYSLFFQFHFWHKLC